MDGYVFLTSSIRRVVFSLVARARPGLLPSVGLLVPVFIVTGPAGTPLLLANLFSDVCKCVRLINCAPKETLSLGKF